MPWSGTQPVLLALSAKWCSIAEYGVEHDAPEFICYVYHMIYRKGTKASETLRLQMLSFPTLRLREATKLATTTTPSWVTTRDAIVSARGLACWYVQILSNRGEVQSLMASCVVVCNTPSHNLPWMTVLLLDAPTPSIPTFTNSPLFPMKRWDFCVFQRAIWLSFRFSLRTNPFRRTIISHPSRVIKLVNQGRFTDLKYFDWTCWPRAKLANPNLELATIQCYSLDFLCGH